jgi:hypothetical protein
MGGGGGVVLFYRWETLNLREVGNCSMSFESESVELPKPVPFL